MVDVDEILENLGPDCGAQETWLSVYIRESCYGGPEEGGWWYTQMAFEGGKRFATREAAEAALERMETWIAGRQAEDVQRRARAAERLPDQDSPYADCGEGYIPRHWRDGGETILVLEEEPGACEQHDVPHYE